MAVNNYQATELTDTSGSLVSTKNITAPDHVEMDKTGNSPSRKTQILCVVLAVLLLCGGLAAGLYIALRPDHDVRTERPTPKVVLPCPRNPQMSEDYEQESCSKQKNCEWVENDEDGITTPYQCRYKTDGDWSVSLDTGTDSQSIYSLSRNSRDLIVDITCRTANELRVKISERSVKRYEVPDDALPIPQLQYYCNNTVYDHSIQDGKFILTHNKVDMISIPLDGSLVFDEQFLQISLLLNSSTNYGLGEHNHRQLKLDMNYKTWSIFTRDVAPVDEWNLYGAQPYFMTMNAQAKSVIGVMLKNSNAMGFSNGGLVPLSIDLTVGSSPNDCPSLTDVTLQPNPSPSLTYRVIGGILDFHFFVSTDPESVTQHYTGLTGRPLMPPYWSLGFQLSRWGYQNLDHVKAVVQRNVDAGIPLDVVYGDIDYMAHKFDFTYNNTAFAGLPEYVKELRSNHTRYVIILDPGIGIEEEKIQTLDGGKYKALDDGRNQDIFVKESNGSNLVGKVWPGLVHYPDFTNPSSLGWWKEQIEDFYYNNRSVSDAGLTFDGLWVDMNEPANFRNGEEAEKVCDMSNKYNSPPYIPENLLGGSMVDKTICMDSVQSWGSHYDTHSLYGHSMAMRTNQALTELFPTKRPFVLTRSTFIGTSKHSIHWLGDNQSQWRQIPWSIVSMLEFSMFGFSMTGADICGFWFNTTESMCQRWMQVGAFYPFARNHNAGFNSGENFLHQDQDPANFGDEVVRSSREVLLTRYRLLPYLYTLMYQAHSKGSTVARPLFFEYMDDEETHDIDRQFLWGPALLISPCLEEDSTEVKAYIPEGIWYDYYTNEKVDNSKSWHTLHTPLDRINLHIRGGHVIPTQQPAINTHLSMQQDFELLLALDENEQAYGEWYLDDGDGADPIGSNTYSIVEVRVVSSKLYIHLTEGGYLNAPNPNITSIQILGLGRRVSSVTVDELQHNGDFNFTHISNTLTVRFAAGKQLDYRQNHTLTWSSV